MTKKKSNKKKELKDVDPRNITQNVRQRLYALSGCECANPDCNNKLVSTDTNTLFSEICHIEAASSDGPRYNPKQTNEKRRDFDNLILLCERCHKEVDNPLNIEKYTVELLKEWKKKHTEKVLSKTINKGKVFPLSIPDGLLPRDNEVDKLFDGISNKRIYNLIGVGGSGKSSLAYLMVQKHKDYFNEIVYVVVKTDIKQDIVSKFNRMLDLKLTYSEIISHLRKKIKSVQPNLLVLDINETASMDKTDIFINEILKDNLLLEGWKFLILSRENVDTRKRISFHNLNDKNDFDFLKKLFLEKAGERYNNFGDFETLFNVIFYNPLMVEQLGIYLSNEPKILTIDDIINILGTSLHEEDMQGMSAQRHNETIISFLKNLIVYDNIRDINERTLLRHFVLWQSDYISYDIIADLLKGIFESDSILNKVLKTLTSRSILATTFNDDKILCYKLHGLLADSLREQIKDKLNVEEYWTAYVDNVRRIIKYDSYKFIPFVDCIGNSLCEYEITANYELLYEVVFKLQMVWKADYADILYNKIIKFLNDKISSDKDNSVYQSILSAILNSFANVQQGLLFDYKSAKSNYEKAIAISEKMPKAHPGFQYVLASAYNNFALCLKSDEDYNAAKLYFEKAIAISEHWPKDDMHQNVLTSAYCNLANLLKNHFDDCNLAAVIYNKIIAKYEQCTTDNNDHQNVLAGAHNNLANVLKKLGNYESAELHYKKAIELYKRMGTGKLDKLAGTYYNLALTQAQQTKDSDAESNAISAFDIYKKLVKYNPNIHMGDWMECAALLEEILVVQGKAEEAKKIFEREIKPLAEKYMAKLPKA